MLLWVAGWFPNSENPYNGIFIHRHAQAIASQNQDLTLLTFVPYPIGAVKPKEFSVSREYSLILVPVPQFDNHWFKTLNFCIYYLVAFGKMLQVLLELNPKIVHVHAADKIGVVAAGLKFSFKYSLWLTEHWAIFNNWVSDRFQNRNLWFQKSYSFLWKRVDVCACVNNQLHESMQNTLGSPKNHVLFPNVIDIEFERYIDLSVESDHDPLIFLHVSNFEERKNVSLIVEAFLRLREQYPQVELILVGGPKNKMGENLEGTFDKLDEHITVIEAVPPSILANFYHKASVLILASDSENAPCVISEALYFGLPVISSNVGGISEMLNQQNSILMDDWDPSANNSAKTLKITTAMLDFCKKCKNFDRLQIKQNAKLKYSSESVALQLMQNYTCVE